MKKRKTRQWNYDCCSAQSGNTISPYDLMRKRVQKECISM